MRSWLSVLIADAMSKKRDDIPIAPSLYSLSNKMDNSLLAVRDINHKYIVVERGRQKMRAVILSLDTGAYKAKADVAAAASLKRMLEQVGIEVRAAKAFPEDKEMLKTVLCKLADAGMVELVLTTGAVGFLEKHCAPDAVRETADRLLPGIPEALRAYNLRHTKKVILDRSEAGIRKKTLMINLPESAKMAKEDLEYILPEVVQVVDTFSLR